MLLTEVYSFSWPSWGRCPDLSVQQNFDIQSYMGKWLIRAGYNLDITQGKGRCGFANYTWDPIQHRVIVNNSQISASTNKWESISGYAVPTDYSKDEGKFTVNLYKWGWWKLTAPYWVLGTDY
ncbi:lipocalin family protein, partial [Pseudophaeobacter profundi]|uniref:lipocalin family protein n=1 Tax=Pseudophaeobacter profundi TaxID=3034152 RepID=UPI00242B7650